MSKMQVKIVDGERLVSEKDFKECLRDKELMQKSLAMLVSTYEDGESLETAMMMAIAYFYTEATGVFHEQTTSESPLQN